jgi:hypothetical protein
MYEKSAPGDNPTIVSYSASAVKIYNATNSSARLQNKNYFSVLYKRSSLLERRRCNCIFKCRWIGYRSRFFLQFFCEIFIGSFWGNIQRPVLFFSFFWVSDPLCLSSSSALLFQIILFGYTTLLTGMTGSSLHMQWPLTYQLHGSVSQREQLVFCYGSNSTPKRPVLKLISSWEFLCKLRTCKFQNWLIFLLL